MRNATAKIFAVFVALLILASGLVAYFVFFASDNNDTGATDDLPGSGGSESSISVSYDGAELANGTSLVLDGLTAKHSFNISETSYTIRIMPNSNADFTFLKDGETCAYVAIQDLTSVFKIRSDGDQFEIDLGDNFTMLKVLEALFPGSEITLPEEFVEIKNYYKLEIISETGAVFTILLGVSNSGVTGVTLNPEKITFGI